MLISVYPDIVKQTALWRQDNRSMERETQNQRQRNWTRHKPRPRRKNSGPAQAGDVLPALLASLGGGPERARLSLLWQNWEPIMGPELAPWATIRIFC